MARRVAPLAVGLVGGGAVVALLVTGSAPASTGHQQPFDSQDCTSGYVEGGVVDSWAGATSTLTADKAKAKAERVMLRGDVVAKASADLTTNQAGRQVWTYHDASGASVAEVALERAGTGWRLAGFQQCAPDGVAEIQGKAPAVAETVP